MTVVDHNSQGMPILRKYDMNGGGFDHSANIVTVENTDRFLHTRDSLDICILSVSEGEIHFCMYTKPGVTNNQAMQFTKIPGSPGMLYSINFPYTSLLRYTRDTITLLA